MKRNENNVGDIFGWGKGEVWPFIEFLSYRETRRATA